MDFILSAKCRCGAWPRVTGWSIPLTCHYLILSHVMFLLSLFAHALVHGLRPSWPSCMFLIFVPTLPVCSLTVSALLCQWSPGVCLCHQPQLPRCFKLKHWKHFSCVVLVQFMQLKTGPIPPQSWCLLKQSTETWRRTEAMPGQIVNTPSIHCNFFHFVLLHWMMPVRLNANKSPQGGHSTKYALTQEQGVWGRKLLPAQCTPWSCVKTWIVEGLAQ